MSTLNNLRFGNKVLDSSISRSTLVVEKPYVEPFNRPFGLIESTTSKWNQSSNKWLQRMYVLFQLTYKKKTNKKIYDKVNSI